MTFYPSHDKVARLASIILPSVGGGFVAGLGTHKISRGAWDAINKLARWKTKAWFKASHSPEELANNIIESGESDSMTFSEFLDQDAAEIESAMLQMDIEMPGVFTPQEESDIRDVLGPDACTINQAQFALFPHSFTPWSFS